MPSRTASRRNPRIAAASLPRSVLRLSSAQAAARDRAALAAALDPIFTVDARGMILSASDSVKTVFGWKPAELLGRNISILMPEPHRSAHDGYLRAYARTGRTRIMGHAREFEGVRKDGSIFPIELCVSRAAVSQGDEPLYVGIIRDMTERTRLGSALAEQTRFNETLIEHMPDIVFRLDRSLRHLFIGGALSRISRLKPHEFIGRTGRELGFPRALCDRFEEVCRNVLATGRPGQLEFEVNGTWILHRLSPERADDGTIVTLLGMAEDITERKRMEEELARHREHLERLVEERTEELRKSYQQIRMADRLASIGTLAAGLGHDMNNVLLPVRAHLNAATAATGEREVQHQVKQAHKGIDYLQQLADGLHFLATDPAQGGGSAQDGDGGGATDLVKWWSQTGALLSKPVPRHVRVVASIGGATDGRREGRRGGRLPKVAIAPHPLTQAVLNLVVNAGQAIPPPPAGTGRSARRTGVIRIFTTVVRKRSRSDGREVEPKRVRLCVQDNGTGMTDEVKRRAFELFFTTKARGMGTGLGLPLVARVIDEAGGSVRIDSKVGKGTTVILDLPAIHAAPRDKVDAARRLAVLSIDDPRAADLFRQMLEAAAFRVVENADPGNAELWIVDPRLTNVAGAKAWQARRAKRARRVREAGRGLVLLGPLDAAQSKAWAVLDPIIVDRPDDFMALREALGRAIARG